MSKFNIYLYRDVAGYTQYIHHRVVDECALKKRIKWYKQKAKIEDCYLFLTIHKPDYTSYELTFCPNGKYFRNSMDIGLTT